MAKAPTTQMAEAISIIAVNMTLRKIHYAFSAKRSATVAGDFKYGATTSNASSRLMA